MPTVRINVLNACEQPLRNATLEIRVTNGSASKQIKNVSAPYNLFLPSTGDFSIIILSTAAGYFDEVVALTYIDKDKQWTTDNAALQFKETANPPDLKVYMGRIRFAPVVQIPESQTVSLPYNPGGILLDNSKDNPFYRTVSLGAPKFRTLKTGVAANVNGKGWDRFNFGDEVVHLDQYGTWVLLEYGDPEWFGKVRQLIGVWAPFRCSKIPSVIVQITPNPQITPPPPAYPADRFPFTGVYPFGCLPHEKGHPDAPDPKKPITLKNLKQPYAELGSRRTLTAYFVADQVYAARTDIFGLDNGPVIITPIPATLSDGSVVREPLNCREGMGRLVGEVLRFLWAKRITTSGDKAGGKFHFIKGSGPEFIPSFAPVSLVGTAPEGFPRSSATTLLGHSAAVLTMSSLVKIPTFDLLKKSTVNSQQFAYFSKDYYGGATTYFDKDWQGLWLIDAVAADRFRQYLSPVAGSEAAKTWLGWQAEQESAPRPQPVQGGADAPPAPNRRAICAVYTETGIRLGERNGLVEGVGRPKVGSAGTVEEAKQGRIAWLRFSDSYLRPTEEPSDKDIVPNFTAGPDFKVHDKVLRFGVGYAAQAFR